MTPLASMPVDVVAKAGGLWLPDAAAAYARAGLSVFPCVPGEKRPLTEHGFTDASTDLNRVAAWWRRWPQANIGLATGRPCGFDVLDIDVHPGGSGFPALRRARQAGLVDGWAVLIRSPSAGRISASRSIPSASSDRGHCRNGMWTSVVRAVT